jgi:hypothetical protein
MLSTSSPRLIEARFDWGDGRSPGSRIDTLHGLPGISSGIACGFTVFSCGGSRGIAPRSRFTLDGHHHARMIKQFDRAPPFRPLQTGPIGQFGGSRMAATRGLAILCTQTYCDRSKRTPSNQRKQPSAGNRSHGLFAEMLRKKYCAETAQTADTAQTLRSCASLSAKSHDGDDSSHSNGLLHHASLILGVA